MTEKFPPAALPTLLGHAVEYLQSGRLGQAESVLEGILGQWPDQADALHLYGICAFKRNDLANAVHRLGRACTVEPAVPEFQFNFGNALRDAGQADLAGDAYREVLRLRPSFVPALRALADLQREQRHYDVAAVLYQQLAGLQPEDFDAWSRAGEMSLSIGQHDRAIAALERAVALRPENCRVWNNLGAAFSQRGYLRSGLDAFKRAIDLEPDYVHALGNYANALRDSGRVDEAMACFERAISLAPTDPLIRSNALFTALYSDRLAPAEVLQAHRKFDPEVAAIAAGQGGGGQGRRPAMPVRVAYLSPDFCEHPVAYFMDGLLRHHRRDRVEIYLYSSSPKIDEWTRRLQSRSATWRDVGAASDEELRHLCGQDRIDILVDLAGHTAFNRISAVARRLAPVQMHYLGYPFSTGIAAMDYRITDGVVDPPGSESLASERLVRLTRSYYAYTAPENTPDVGPLPMTSNGALTFGVSSNLAKVSPQALTHWADLLRAIPDSRLHWRAKAFDDQETLRRMTEALTSRGIEADRVTLVAWAASSRRWDFFAQIDVALDTFPYNQATNTCEALWMGVPTLTVAGESHQARMGASIMDAAGLPEFVATDADDWVNNGKKMTESAERLSEIRSTLRRRLLQSTLMDVVGLAAELEAIYLGVC